jgi:hypothetical protein
MKSLQNKHNLTLGLALRAPPIWLDPLGRRRKRHQDHAPRDR